MDITAGLIEGSAITYNLFVSHAGALRVELSRSK